MVDERQRYILEHSTPQGEVLDWVEKQTELHTNRAHMLSGPILGRFLMFLVDMLKPQRVLELGTFTGYSSICLASRMPAGGRLDSLEINDELEDVIREGFARAGFTERISLYIGDCRETLERLRSAGEVYDLVYIDANKRQYVEYYGLVIDMVRSGGYILADNVLWDSKVYGDAPSLSNLSDLPSAPQVADALTSVPRGGSRPASLVATEPQPADLRGGSRPAGLPSDLQTSGIAAFNDLVAADLRDGSRPADLPSDLQTSGIAAFNSLIASDSRVESVILPIRDGLSLIRKL